MIGDVILLNRKKGGWFSFLQRKFSGLPFTHCAISAGFILGEESCFSASEMILLERLQAYYEEDGTDITIYHLPTISDQIKYDTIKELYKTYNGQFYGFLQLLFFVYRFLGEKLGFDMRRKKNWFPKNIICSEMLWYYFYMLREHIPGMSKVLDQWNPNNVFAGEIDQICQMFPEHIIKVKGV